MGSGERRLCAHRHPFQRGRARSSLGLRQPGSSAAPGTQTWTQKEITIPNTPIGTVVLNVVRPTLTAYLPDAAKASGTGIIIAPGGYCVALAMDVEGTRLARSLQARGIAALFSDTASLKRNNKGHRQTSIWIKLVNTA